MDGWRTDSVSAIIFVFDATKCDTMQDAKSMLNNITQRYDAPIMVLGNKIDLKDAMHENDCREMLDLGREVTYGLRYGSKEINLEATCRVEVYMGSVVRHCGVVDAMRWLEQLIS